MWYFHCKIEAVNPFAGGESGSGLDNIPGIVILDGPEDGPGGQGPQAGPGGQGGQAGPGGQGSEGEGGPGGQGSEGQEGPGGQGGSPGQGGPGGQGPQQGPPGRVRELLLKLMAGKTLQWRHISITTPHYWPFVRGIYRWISPTKWQ